MRYVDFHMHTQASDGTWSPSDAIKNIKKAEIESFAVTDHDSIGSVPALIELAKTNNLEFITGAEFSSTVHQKEHHILAYNFSINNEAILGRLKRNREIRTAYHIELIQTVQKDFPQISLQEFLEYQEDLSRGGWISLNYLLDKKVIFNMYEFFTLSERYQVGHIFDSPESVIADIKKAGAIPILAHPPGYHESGIMPLSELEEWVHFGIEGLECYSPYYKNPDDSLYYTAFCNSNNLYISGGSDCHGEFVAKRKLRQPTIERHQVRLPFITE